jgi:hypothetical protein
MDRCAIDPRNIHASGRLLAQAFQVSLSNKSLERASQITSLSESKMNSLRDECK